MDTWICPFSFHVKELSLHLFVCLFVCFFFRSGQRVFLMTGVGFADFTTGESHRLWRKLLIGMWRCCSMALTSLPLCTSHPFIMCDHRLPLMNLMMSLLSTWFACFFLEKSTNQKTTRTSLERSFWNLPEECKYIRCHYVMNVGGRKRICM